MTLRAQALRSIPLNLCIALNERHKEIARRLFQGENPGRIAADLMVTTELVSIVRGSALARDFISALEVRRDAQAVDVSVDLRALARMVKKLSLTSKALV